MGHQEDQNPDQKAPSNPVSFPSLEAPNPNRKASPNPTPLPPYMKDKEIPKTDFDPDGQITAIPVEADPATPIHHVEVEKSFYMSKFEITNKQWNIVAKIGKAEKNDPDLEVTTDDSAFPKVNVSYFEVKEFCERLSRDLSAQSGRKVTVRLPSEEEWEYACRGTKKNTKYSGGNLPDDNFVNAIIFYSDSPQWSIDLMRKVTKPQLESSLYANSYGLVAMSGNVWEMVADRWHPNYNNKKTTSDDTQMSGGGIWELPVRNGSDDERKYVLRGGAYNEGDFMSQCSYRKSDDSLSPGNVQTGFRVVMEIE